MSDPERRSFLAVDKHIITLFVQAAVFRAVNEAVVMRPYINPFKAWEEMQQYRERYDAVLLARRMIGMSGGQLARRIKGLYPDMPIIGVTGNPGNWQQMPSIESGIDLVVIKPVTMGMARQTIQFIEQFIAANARSSELPPQVLQMNTP